MSRIERIFQEVSSLYESGLQVETVNLPKIMEVPFWIVMSRDYLKVASLLCEDLHSYFLPYAQNVGLSLELALKAFILSCEQNIPFTHDLINLCKKCEEYGFGFEDRDIAAISHLHHFYFKNLITATKFNSRYPGSSGGSIGNYSDYESIINHILMEAQKKFNLISARHS